MKSFLGLLLWIMWMQTTSASYGPGLGFPSCDDLAGHCVVRVFKAQDFVLSGTKKPSHLSNPTVIFEDREGFLFVGTLAGLCRYNEEKDEWLCFSELADPEMPTSIAQDSRGTLWFRSGLRQDVKYLSENNWREAEKLGQFGAKRVHSLFKGRNGLVWFILDEGLIFYNGQQWSSLYSPSQKVNERYSSFPKRYKSPIEEWRAQMSEASKSRNVSNHQRNAALEYCFIGMEDRYGLIWLGTRNGILTFNCDKNEWQAYPLPNRVVEASLLYEDREGRLWIADNNGHVSAYDRATNTWRGYTLTNETNADASDLDLEAIFQDKQGRMMFGTDRGLITLDRGGMRDEPLTARNSCLLGSHVSAITEDKAGRIWLGTNGGLMVLAP